MSLEDDPSACQLTVFRQSNCFFQTRQNAIIGCRYLGKYVSVFDAVKSIFFSETSSTRIMGAEIPANYPFNDLSGVAISHIIGTLSGHRWLVT